MDWVLLRGLPEEDVETVLAAGRVRRFARREVVWHEGDRTETIHLIKKGRIGVRAGTSIGDIVTVVTLGPGQAAGLVAAMATERYSSTGAIALEATETIAIQVDDLAAIRRRLPAVNEAVIGFIADLTIMLAARLADALYVPAEVRVIRRLVALCEAYDVGEGGEIVIPLTQEGIAELAGVTRPTVNRVLNREKSAGNLKVARGSVTVLNADGLARRVL
jgi:CRP/FNR family cyclic AMP-dependent transcriptional regulator